MKAYLRLKLFGLVVVFFSCNNNETEIVKESILLDKNSALEYSKLPLHCVEVEYPNKTSHIQKIENEITTPKFMHPSFYGCFDWHSSVHGHSMLVKLLKNYKDLPNQTEIRQKIGTSLTKENILKELEYFKNNPFYERTYGWAWLLKLAEELYTWDDPQGKELYNNIKPLSRHISISLQQYLNKMTYTIRVGTHNNMAFSLFLSLEYARVIGDKQLEEIIVRKSKDYYLNDKNIPYWLEPDGTDFLSPSLCEAVLMSIVLEKNEYVKWLNVFLPDLLNEKKNTYSPAIVSDNTDYQIVHLEGLNLSRGWALKMIARKLNSQYLMNKAEENIKASMGNVLNSNYGGSHWLATYLVYALLK